MSTTHVSKRHICIINILHYFNNKFLYITTDEKTYGLWICTKYAKYFTVHFTYRYTLMHMYYTDQEEVGNFVLCILFM